ncbi:SDR family oxidoreductase, partial [Nocardiopsis tropica]|nr:SDR family oxidoreductase [Nocardiopsis tropica]
GLDESIPPVAAGSRSAMEHVEREVYRACGREGADEMYGRLREAAGLEISPRACWALSHLGVTGPLTGTELARMSGLGEDAWEGVRRELEEAGYLTGGGGAWELNGRGADAARQVFDAQRTALRSLLADYGPGEHPEVVAALGGIDVVVNNAAVNTAHPVAGVSYEEWQEAWRTTLDVNVVAAANIGYLAARHMIDRGARGHIVNIGSRGAYKGEPDHPAYGASKAALHSLGQSLAAALAPHGIAVASVAPGFVATERVADRVTDEVRAQSPFGRVAAPEEVAAAVLYLASPEAVWSSGAVLDVNGASHLR